VVSACLIVLSNLATFALISVKSFHSLAIFEANLFNLEISPSTNSNSFLLVIEAPDRTLFTSSSHGFEGLTLATHFSEFFHNLVIPSSSSQTCFKNGFSAQLGILLTIDSNFKIFSFIDAKSFHSLAICVAILFKFLISENTTFISC
jgi:hypothetical protein